VVGVAARPALVDEAAVLEQLQVPRDARLRESEDRGQLGDVQPLDAEDPQQAKTGFIAQQPVARRSATHITKSTCSDAISQAGRTTPGPPPPRRGRFLPISCLRSVIYAWLRSDAYPSSYLVGAAPLAWTTRRAR